MKKLLTILLSAIMAVACCFGLAACGDDDGAGADVKIGLICLHDNNSTYDKNFIDAFTAACSATGAKSIIKTNIPEGQECYDAAADLVDQGCNVVFANSFGHEPYMIQAAQEFTDVQFYHATGTRAHTEGLANYHNAFASIYEGRYLAGVAAGLKLQAMVAADQISADKYENGNIKIGYIGAFPYAEVVSGYTSWFLGVRSVVSNVVMKVQYTSSWYDENGEKTAAENLISNEKVALLSQHADSWGAPTACETAGIPNVSYNGSTASRCPNTFIISSRINWQPYYEHIINAAKNGTKVAADWSQGLGSNWGDGAVALTEVGAAAAEGTEAYLNNVISQLKAGTLKVFDTSKFTVNGARIPADQKANVNCVLASNGFDDGSLDTEVVKTENGITYYAESEFRSAPYFDLRIDGITELN